MEAEPDGHGVLWAMVCLLARSRSDAQQDEYEICAMEYHPLGRQATRAPELHRAPVKVDTFQARISRPGQVAKAVRQGTIQRPSLIARNEVRCRAVLRAAPWCDPAFSRQTAPSKKKYGRSQSRCRPSLMWSGRSATVLTRC